MKVAYRACYAFAAVIHGEQRRSKVIRNRKGSDFEYDILLLVAMWRGMKAAEEIVRSLQEITGSLRLKRLPVEPDQPKPFLFVE
ncbi:MAG: hypothetical protein ACM3X6_06560 [Patescibacteria group bacterium]